MSTDAERLLIRCGLPQYTTVLLNANLSTLQSMQAKRTLIPAIVPNRAHAERILQSLGEKGSASSVNNSVVDPIAQSLDDWEAQLLTRLRGLAEQHTQLMQIKAAPARRVSSITGVSTTVTVSKAEMHDTVVKMEHCKTLLAAVHSARRSHRKYVEMSKIVEKFRNRAGDPKELDMVRTQLEENLAYVNRVLVTLQEEARLHVDPSMYDEDNDERATSSHRDASVERQRSSVRGRGGSARTSKRRVPAPPPTADDADVSSLWSEPLLAERWASAVAEYDCRAQRSMEEAEWEERCGILQEHSDTRADLILLLKARLNAHPAA